MPFLDAERERELGGVQSSPATPVAGRTPSGAAKRKTRENSESRESSTSSSSAEEPAAKKGRSSTLDKDKDAAEKDGEDASGSQQAAQQQQQDGREVQHVSSAATRNDPYFKIFVAVSAVLFEKTTPDTLRERYQRYVAALAAVTASSGGGNGEADKNTVSNTCSSIPIKIKYNYK